ncbi:MAG: SDR family NAD(P)-dependent oxidoreductase [Luminiphilus sp.]|nr:SDR family NAD(P)-dependent oxidoreductase [Luminiphilus sp.]
MAMLDLDNKTVVITGGATGIGFGLAKACGQRGARIVIGEPRRARLDEAIALLDQEGITARAFPVDVSVPAELETFAERAFAAFGDVALVINNAGVGQKPGSVLDTPLEEMRRVMAVNFEGVWLGCKIFGERLVKQGSPAALYNTGSENSFFIAVENAAVYVASKHAVYGLTDALRAEVPDFIKVGMIAPGFVGSELIPEFMRALGMPVDDFVAIVLPQILAGEPYAVSHGYNLVRIEERHGAIADAYSSAAPLTADDDRYDVKKLLATIGSTKSFE